MQESSVAVFRVEPNRLKLEERGNDIGVPFDRRRAKRSKAIVVRLRQRRSRGAEKAHDINIAHHGRKVDRPAKDPAVVRSLPTGVKARSKEPAHA